MWGCTCTVRYYLDAAHISEKNISMFESLDEELGRFKGIDNIRRKYYNFPTKNAGQPDKRKGATAERRK